MSLGLPASHRSGMQMAPASPPSPISSRPRAKVTQEDIPSRRQSSGGFSRWISSAYGVRSARAIASTQMQGSRRDRLRSEPSSRTPPHGPLRISFGHVIGQVIPVLRNTHWPHIRQEKRMRFTGASMNATVWEARSSPHRSSGFLSPFSRRSRRRHIQTRKPGCSWNVLTAMWYTNPYGGIVPVREELKPRRRSPPPARVGQRTYHPGGSPGSPIEYRETTLPRSRAWARRRYGRAFTPGVPRALARLRARCRRGRSGRRGSRARAGPRGAAPGSHRARVRAGAPPAP